MDMQSQALALAAQKNYSGHNIINSHGADLPMGPYEGQQTFVKNGKIQQKYHANNFKKKGFDSYHSGNRQNFNGMAKKFSEARVPHVNVNAPNAANYGAVNQNQASKVAMGVPNYYSKELTNSSAPVIDNQHSTHIISSPNNLVSSSSIPAPQITPSNSSIANLTTTTSYPQVWPNPPDKHKNKNNNQSTNNHNNSDLPNLIKQTHKLNDGSLKSIEYHTILDCWLKFSLYPLSNYNFGTKDMIIDDQETENFIETGKINLEKLEQEYKQSGMRTTVEAVLIVHEHRLPHLLLLQKTIKLDEKSEGNNNGSEQTTSSIFKLPGGTLEDKEDPHLGLKRILRKILGKSHSRSFNKNNNNKLNSENDQNKDDWVIKDCLGQWYRPNFDQKTFSYKPAHVTRFKENKKFYLVQLPPRALFAVPRNYKLVAAPLHEVYNNVTIYGEHIAFLPHLLSRFEIDFQWKWNE